MLPSAKKRKNKFKQLVEIKKLPLRGNIKRSNDEAKEKQTNSSRILQPAKNQPGNAVDDQRDEHCIDIM